MAVHEWRDETDAGEVRFVRARLHGRQWTIEVRLKSELEWVALSPPPLDELRALRDVLWRKYQRGRVPHEHVVRIDALIEQVEGRR